MTFGIKLDSIYILPQQRQSQQSTRLEGLGRYYLHFHHFLLPRPTEFSLHLKHLLAIEKGMVRDE